MNVDYSALADNILDGTFRQELENELAVGFRMIHHSGERLPTPSHYAAQIAEIISRNAPDPLQPDLAFGMYQEVLAACESAHASVLAEDVNR